MYDITKLAAIEMPFLDSISQKLAIFKRVDKDKNPLKPGRSCLIYGTNGSGKSTFARNLRTNIEDVVFLDKNETPINPTGSENNIFIYDEHYIQQYFRLLNHDRITAIVLFGESAEDSIKEDSLNKRLELEESEFQDRQSERNKAKADLSSLKSEIKKLLTSNQTARLGGWQPRTTTIHISATKKQLREATLDQLIENAYRYFEEQEDHMDASNTTTTYNTLCQDFENILESLNNKNKLLPLEWKFPILPNIDPIAIQNDVNNYELGKKQLSNIKNEIEQRITESGLNPRDLEELSKELFSPSSSDYCPKCFQTITKDYAELAKTALEEHIRAIQTDHSYQKLKGHMISWDFNIDLIEGFTEGNDLRNEIEHSLERLRLDIEEFNNQIDAKLAHPLEQVTIDATSIENNLSTLKSLLQDYSKLIENHNENIPSPDQLREKAYKINDELAYYEIKTLLPNYINAEKECKKKETILAEAKKKRDDTLSELRKIQEKQKSTKTAASQINTLLQYALGPKALKLEAVEDGYLVTNRNSQVPPQYLSTGEQNLLSLCYFITQLGDGRKLENAYTANQLIVLDDPISSFDRDNKYGVMGLLRWFIRKCLKADSKCKICILTHDLNVFSELEYALQIDSDRNTFELASGKLMSRKAERIDYYQRYLSEMFSLACDKTPSTPDSSSYPIDPNHVRRVWEAFVTFMLDENPSNAFTSNKVEALFESRGEQYEAFFNSTPSRIFIHKDSHAENQLRWDDPFLIPSLTNEEYKRFVKDILAFMHIVAPHHIPSRLEKKAEKALICKEKLDEIVNEVIGLDTKP